jgi:hypothetical protein
MSPKHAMITAVLLLAAFTVGLGIGKLSGLREAREHAAYATTVARALDKANADLLRINLHLEWLLDVRYNRRPLTELERRYTTLCQ